MSALIVIPARYASTRFPGKPLADIAGKSLLRRVWERCEPVLGSDHVIVATDDERIGAHCDEQGMRWVMTPSDCATGTDRVAAVAESLPADVYINVQGDEPMIRPADIEMVIRDAERNPGEILNAYCEITEEQDFFSRNVPKVITRPDGRLLYMSRSPIPGAKSGKFKKAWKQVCIYGFPPAALKAYAATNGKTTIEEVEDIEILRFLELGFDVRMVTVSGSSIAVDEPADVLRVLNALEVEDATA